LFRPDFAAFDVTPDIRHYFIFIHASHFARYAFSIRILSGDADVTAIVLAYAAWLMLHHEAEH